MKLREFVIVFIMVISAVGMWCLYVVKMQEAEVMRQFNAIQPLDFTVTYCKSCTGCNTQQELDAIEFEACLQEDLDKLEEIQEKEIACQL